MGINPFFSGFAHRLTEMNFVNGATHLPTKKELDEFQDFSFNVVVLSSVWILSSASAIAYTISYQPPLAQELLLLNTFTAYLGYDLFTVSENFSDLANRIYQIKVMGKQPNSLERTLTETTDANAFHLKVMNEATKGAWLSRFIFKLCYGRAQQ